MVSLWFVFGLGTSVAAVSAHDGRRAAAAGPASGAGQSVESQHFMANTYGFLRSTSDMVGQSANTVLAVQSNLDDMRRDLAGEYSRWAATQKDLTAEGERLKSSIARLQAEQSTQASLSEHKLRLQAELAQRQEETQKAIELGQQAKEAFNAKKKQIEGTITSLTSMIQAAQVDRAVVYKSELNKTASELTTNTKLQEKVVKLNAEVEGLKKQHNMDQVSAAEHKKQVLSQIAAVQAEVNTHQAEAMEQAKLKQELEAYRQQLAAAIDQVNTQKTSFQQLQVTCIASKRSTETQIALAKNKLELSNAAIRECQDVDAKNQRLTETLNQCLAASRAR